MINIIEHVITTKSGSGMKGDYNTMITNLCIYSLIIVYIYCYYVIEKRRVLMIIREEEEQQQIIKELIEKKKMEQDKKEKLELFGKKIVEIITKARIEYDRVEQENKQKKIQNERIEKEAEFQYIIMIQIILYSIISVLYLFMSIYNMISIY